MSDVAYIAGRVRVKVKAIGALSALDVNTAFPARVSEREETVGGGAENIKVSKVWVDVVVELFGLMRITSDHLFYFILDRTYTRINNNHVSMCVLTQL